MNALEIGTSVFGAIYVVLAARNIVWCWPAGIISAALCIAFDIELKYYLDAVLQAYYVLAGFYGWYLWSKKDAAQQPETRITSYTIRQLLPWLLLGLVLTPVLGYVFAGLGNSYPYVDAFTAVFSFITTYLTARKVLEGWAMWVVIDAVLIAQYLVKNANVLAIFYLFLTIVAFYAYIDWRKQYRQSYDV